MTKNVRDEFKEMTVEEIRQHQPKIGAEVAFVNITNDLNMTMSIRTAALFGFDKVHIFGRRKIDRRPLVGCQNYIDITRHSCMLDEQTVDYDWVLDFLHENNYYVVACDTYGNNDISNDITLNKIKSHTHANKKPIFIFGNEGKGLDLDFVKQCDYSVFIRQHSVMRSLNVSVAASIIMHEYKEFLLGD